MSDLTPAQLLERITQRIERCCSPANRATCKDCKLDALIREGLAALVREREQQAAEIARLSGIVKSQTVLMEAICPHCQNAYQAEMDVPQLTGVLTDKGYESYADIRKERDALTAALAEARKQHTDEVERLRGHRCVPANWPHAREDF